MKQKTPYLVLEKKQLIKNYKELDELCKTYLKKYKIAYSIKTNSLKPVIKTLNKLGSGFEAASLQELKLIPKKSEFTILNGPCKTKKELQIAIKRNYLINIDSLQEIQQIAEILKSQKHKDQNNKKLEIGLRISLIQSKFGIDQSQLQQALTLIKENNMQLTSLHFHQGTRLKPIEYESNLKQTLKFLKKTKLNPKYINLGGGLPDTAIIKNYNTTLDYYFKLIEKYLSNTKATFIIEPGRALVSSAMHLITKVHYIKHKHNNTYAILDAGINLLPKITLANHKITKLTTTHSPTKPKSENYTLAGPLLFSNDIIAQFQGHLEQGDLLKITNAGAYCYNLAWTISYPKPKVYIK
jgi:diaminopimelate decarboxylase